MNAWKSEVWGLLRLMAANTEYLPELVISLVVGLAVGVIVLQKMAKGMRCAMADTGRSAVIMVLGAIIVLAGTAAVNIYVVPQLRQDFAATAVPIAAAVILFLALVIPMAMLLLKGNYFKCLAPVILAAIAALVISFLVRGAGDAVRKGGKDFDKTKERTKNVNEIL